MALSPGDRLGPYEIVAPLGAGGMGEVYKAKDTRLGRDVAIKVLPSDVAQDENRLARFEHEARTVAALNHPGIVTLFSIEEANGIRFLTMELVEGQSLDRHVVPGGLPVSRVVELGIAMAEALAAAHEKGVVHRDLKPANVMLTRDGRVKILDFGLAKLQAPNSAVDRTQAATLGEPLSSAGQVMGTVPYMAPEQVRGEPVDSRTDLFALGILLYELATGRRPFQGGTIGVISSAILRDTPPSLTDLRTDVPSDLGRIVSRCLEKDPGARVPSALDLARLLRGMRPGRDVAPVSKLPPRPSTPLVGREAAIESALTRLRSGTRLLTITGYGGTGKTRFAIELSHRVAHEFPGGACFVSLASVTSPSEVLPTVATALDIGEAHGRSAIDALATVIADRRVLLALDNLEQVIDAAGDVAAFLARCPSLHVIATSRSPLKVGAESEFDLPPLELPATGATSLEALASCPSVALLVERAAKVKAGFVLTRENAEAIVAICRRLDGLPLALELAAARIRILEPSALLARLDHALDLLTSGDRDLPLRQRTLRATISWSYSLLGTAEQQLLRRASVFHEGFTLEALEQVCYGEAERSRALDELDSLVEKGLVRVSPSGDRYTLLETIRAFAAEQLHAGGEVEAIRSAHADYFVKFSAEVADGIFGTAQLEAMRRGHHENANTQAALQWLSGSARSGNVVALEKALLLSGQLDWFWHICAQHLTARVWLDELLALAADRPPSRGRALAFLAAGMVSTTTGEWERSLREWSSGEADGKAVGDERAAAEGLMGVGYCNVSLGRMDEAKTALDEAIARSTRIGFDFMQGLSKAMKAMLLFATGHLDAGMALAEEARQIHARMGDHEARGVATSFLAQMTFSKGDHARALALYLDALASLERVGDHPEIARVHCEMGWTALASSHSRAAHDAFVRAVHEYELVGSPRGTGLALLGLAAVEAAAGRPERAVAIAAAAEGLSQRAGVVIAHPMDPGLAGRIEALKSSIPKAKLDGLVAGASTLSPADVLAMVAS